MIYYRPIKILFGPIFVYFYKPKPPEDNNSHIVFIKTIIIFKLENWKYFMFRFFKKRQMSTLCHQKDLWRIAILWQIRWFYPTWNWKNPYLSKLSDQIQFMLTAGYVTSDIAVLSETNSLMVTLNDELVFRCFAKSRWNAKAKQSIYALLLKIKI